MNLTLFFVGAYVMCKVGIPVWVWVLYVLGALSQWIKNDSNSRNSNSSRG